MTKLSGSCWSKTCLGGTWYVVSPIGKVPSLDGARQKPLNSSVPFSSGEAEPNTTGRVAAGVLQTVQVFAKVSLEVKLEAHTDSTANFGMHSRTGSGRARHLDVRWLWPQDAV